EPAEGPGRGTGGPADRHAALSGPEPVDDVTAESFGKFFQVGGCALVAVGNTERVVGVPNPNRPASITPGTAILAWVTRTAFGSPLVPEVKISMSRSSAAAGTGSTGARAGSSSS